MMNRKNITEETMLGEIWGEQTRREIKRLKKWITEKKFVEQSVLSNISEYTTVGEIDTILEKSSDREAGCVKAFTYNHIKKRAA